MKDFANITEKDIKDIVKGTIAEFSSLRGKNAYYTVTLTHEKPNTDGTDNLKEFMFPVSLEDIGTASLFAEMKAITLMRYIRKALKAGEFVPSGKPARRRFKVNYRAERGGYFVSIPSYDGGDVIETREVK